MKRAVKIVSVILVLVLLAPAVATAATNPLGDWIARTGAHKIGGYVTIGLAVTAAGLGIAGSDAHPYLGYTTAAVAAGALGAGLLAYSDLLPVVWPHAVLNGLAVVGFGLNAFVFEGGSAAHIATGITSVALLGASYTAIRLIMR